MRKISISVIVLFVLIIGIILVTKQKSTGQEFFNRIELSENNHIVNTLMPSYYDTILSVGLDLAGLESNVIVISPLSDESKASFGGSSLKAHIRYYNGVYYLFIDKLDRLESMLVISHEIIHIKQYSSSDLIYENNVLIWKGEEMDINNIDYGERPWEAEAFFNESKLFSVIYDKLYR